jgi:peroxiredoxin
MKEYSLQKPQTHGLLPYILLAGLLAGIVSSWFLFRASVSPALLVATYTPTSRPTIAATPTAAALQIVEITPEENIQPGAHVGKPAPDFSLNTLAGQRVSLSDFKGKAVLINLWASWCPPCRYEMPAIQAVYEKDKDKGLVVLAIDFTAQDNIQDVKTFAQESELTFPILLDETGEISVGLYGMRGLPTSYFIDTDGVIQYIQVGAMLPETLKEQLAKILPK